MPKTISTTKYWNPGSTPSVPHRAVMDLAREVSVPCYLTQSKRNTPMLIITMPDGNKWSVTYFFDRGQYRIFSDYMAPDSPIQRRWDLPSIGLAALFIRQSATEMRDGTFSYEHAKKPGG